MSKVVVLQILNFSGVKDGLNLWGQKGHFVGFYVLTKASG